MACVIVACVGPADIVVDYWRLRWEDGAPSEGVTATELVRRWRWTPRRGWRRPKRSRYVQLPTSTQLNMWGGVLEELLNQPRRNGR